MGRAKTPKTTDLNRVVDQVLDTLDTNIKRTGAKVRRESLPTIDCHYTLVGQLFQNLIENALRFRRDDVVPEILVSYRDESGTHHFSVKDNGKGVAAEHHGRIFEIFQRLDGTKDDGGTGIGLAICQRVVSSHDGRMWVESEAGAGATFHFTLGTPSNPEDESGDEL